MVKYVFILSLPLPLSSATLEHFYSIYLLVDGTFLILVRSIWLLETSDNYFNPPHSLSPTPIISFCCFSSFCSCAYKKGCSTESACLVALGCQNGYVRVTLYSEDSPMDWNVDWFIWNGPISSLRFLWGIIIPVSYNILYLSFHLFYFFSLAHYVRIYSGRNTNE